MTLHTHFATHTLSVRRSWQPVYLVGHRDRACLQHLIIQLFLFQRIQLLIQLVLINRVANRRRCDGIRDLLSQRMLFSEFLPTQKGLAAELGLHLANVIRQHTLSRPQCRY